MATIFIDLETTGLNPESDEIIEIGAIKISKGENLNFQTFLKLDPKTEKKLGDFITYLTGITPEDLDTKGVDAKTGLIQFVQFCQKDNSENEPIILVAHNADFDHSVLQKALKKNGVELHYKIIDTLKTAFSICPYLDSYSLPIIKKIFNFPPTTDHRALDDCQTTLHLWLKLREEFQNLTPLEKKGLGSMLPPLLGESGFLSYTPEKENRRELMEHLFSELFPNSEIGEETPPPHPQKLTPPEQEPPMWLDQDSPDFLKTLTEEVLGKPTLVVAEHNPFPPTDMGEISLCHKKIKKLFLTLKNRGYFKIFVLTALWYRKTRGEKPFPFKTWYFKTRGTFKPEELSFLPGPFLQPESPDECQSCPFLSPPSQHSPTSQNSLCSLGHLTLGFPLKKSYFIPFTRYFYLKEINVPFQRVCFKDFNKFQENSFKFMGKGFSSSLISEEGGLEKILPDWRLFNSAVLKGFAKKLKFKEDFHRIDFTYESLDELQLDLPFFSKGLTLLFKQMADKWLPQEDHFQLQRSFQTLLKNQKNLLQILFYKKGGETFWDLNLAPGFPTPQGDIFSLSSIPKSLLTGRGFYFQEARGHLKGIIPHLTFKTPLPELVPLNLTLNLPEGCSSESEKLTFFKNLILQKKPGEAWLLILPSISILKKWHHHFLEFSPNFQEEKTSKIRILWEFIDCNLNRTLKTGQPPGDGIFITTKNAFSENLMHPFDTLIMTKMDFPYLKSPSLLLEKSLFNKQAGSLSTPDSKGLINLLHTLYSFQDPNKPKNFYLLDSPIYGKAYFKAFQDEIGIQFLSNP